MKAPAAFDAAAILLAAFFVRGPEGGAGLDVRFPPPRDLGMVRYSMRPRTFVTELASLAAAAAEFIHTEGEYRSHRGGNTVEP